MPRIVIESKSKGFLRDILKAVEALNYPEGSYVLTFSVGLDVNKGSAKYASDYKAGDKCRKCQGTLISVNPKRTRRPGRQYYEWYCKCPRCNTQYMPAAGLRNADGSTPGN